MYSTRWFEDNKMLPHYMSKITLIHLIIRYVDTIFADSHN